MSTFCEVNEIYFLGTLQAKTSYSMIIYTIQILNKLSMDVDVLLFGLKQMPAWERDIHQPEYGFVQE